MPGGRWLLSAHKDGKESVMTYIDLDSEALEPRVLLTVGKGGGGYDPVDSFDFWIVPDAPTLMFRVVMWNPCFVEPSSRKLPDGLIPIPVSLMIYQSA